MKKSDDRTVRQKNRREKPPTRKKKEKKTKDQVDVVPVITLHDQQGKRGKSES